MVIAIDIGGSKFMTATMNPTGDLHHLKTHIYDGKTGFAPFFEMLKFEIATILRQTGAEKPAGIGISVPGPADPTTGTLIFAPYSGWRNIQFKALLENEFHLPVFVENDVNACAIGEKRFGVCREKQHFLWVTLSNGIGGAVFCDGKLFRGASGMAGEVGHIFVQPNGPECGCGHRGCLEAVASATALALQVAAEIERNPSAAQNYPDQTRRELVKRTFELARQGDAFSRNLVETAARFVGLGLAPAVNLLNPELIVFGGGMSLSLDLMADKILQTIQAHVLPGLADKLQIIGTALGYHASLMGAGTLALKNPTSLSQRIC
jgi:glucokinase